MSSAPVKSTSRIEYLDYLRGVLMALGVVTHAGYVYAAGSTWRISDLNAQSIVFHWLIEFLHLFRLQSFFILSGFLFSLSATKNGVVPTFARRASRIGVPLAVVLLFINSAEVLVCQYLYRKPRGLPVYDLWQVNENQWLGHLWFLTYLLGFHILALLVGRIRDKFGVIPSVAGDSVAQYMVYVPLFAGVYEFVVRAATKLIPQIHTVFVGLSLFDWLLFLPFYAVGVIAGTNRKVGAELSKVRPQHLAMLAVFGWMLLWNPFSGSLAIVADRLAHVGLVWICCITCFYAFEKLCRVGGAVLGFIRKISEASYTIYLFHHITVIILAILILDMAWPVWLKFSVVLVVASTTSYALHWFVIRRFPLMAFLFNGVPLAESARQRDVRSLRSSTSAANGGTSMHVGMALRAESSGSQTPQ